ncbi:MAG: hypothetical protein NT076_02490 [Candidatus Pacearchaeota archaeon]|nr:hypothetical protein [Candidatus Pacearchaeota archaeon]
MNVLKHCPHCNSSRIAGNILLEDGRYIQIIKCKKCGYSNHRDIGSAEKQNG